MKCDDCYYSERCFLHDEECGQYFKYITKGEVMKAAKKQTRAEKDAHEGAIVQVYDLKMKPVGRGVVEYVSINALPKEKQEELRDSGSDTWTRVHMEDGSTLFAYDHYIQFIDDTAHAPEPTITPKVTPSEPKPKAVPRKRGRSASAPNIASLESWLTKRDKKDE